MTEHHALSALRSTDGNASALPRALIRANESQPRRSVSTRVSTISDNDDKMKTITITRAMCERLDDGIKNGIKKGKKRGGLFGSVAAMPLDITDASVDDSVSSAISEN